MNILITGGNGFIAHHMILYFLEKTEHTIYTTYRSSRERIPCSSRVKLMKMNLNEMHKWDDCENMDFIIHMAANTWVDGSLKDCIPFIESNVLGTGHLLEWIKKNQPRARVCMFSSDEVLGPAKEGEYFKEDAPLKPSNPYSATKAAQEMLAHSFVNSFGLDIFIVRSMNVIGENESENKFIGKTIKAIREGKKITLHGTGPDNVASRHWIYARDVAQMVHSLFTRARTDEIYHIVGKEMDVYKLSEKLVKLITGRDISDNDVEFIDFHKARPGHDKRYSLMNTKIPDVSTPIDDVLKLMVGELNDN